MTQPPVAAPSRPPSVLPTIGVVLSMLFCTPTVLIGWIFGAIALAQGKGSKPMAILSIAIPAVWLPLAFLVSWPMLHAEQRRQRESECRGFLKQAYVAEQAELAEHDAYSTDWEKIGFAPDGHLRYAYFFSTDSVMTRPFEQHPLPPLEKLKAGMSKELLEDLGPHGKCPDDCWVTLACAGDLFEDGEIDVWSVSSRKRKDKYGIDREAGELIHHTAR